MLEIKKGVPVTPSRGVGREPYFPELSLMEVGDSIFPPLNGEDGVTMQRRLYSSCYHITKKTGKRFATRVFEDCVGIWRINDDGTIPGTEKSDTVSAAETPKPAATRPPQPAIVALKRARGRPRKVTVHVEKRA